MTDSAASISYAVETAGLCKHYGNVPVLHDVALRVPTGSLFGFLGPNGAGKSTTIRVLLGLLRRSRGVARVLGRDAWSDGPRIRAQIGYLPGDVRFYDYLTGAKVLAFLDRVRGGGGAAEIARLADLLDLDLSKKVRRYSRGMKQKLGLIGAMAHRPALLILDEPTTALDPLVRVAVFQELRRAADEGRTVLFSSHTLSEVESLCDDVAIVRAGRLIEQGRIEDLRRRALRAVEVTFDGHVPPEDTAPPGLRIKDRRAHSWSGAWVGPVEPLLTWLAKQQIRDVVIAPPALEDLFLAYYTNQPSASPPSAVGAEARP